MDEEAKIKKPQWDPDFPNQPGLTIGELPPDVPRPWIVDAEGERRRARKGKLDKLLAQREKLDFIWSVFLNSQRKADVMLQKIIVEAHGDPKSPMSLDRGIKLLKEFLGKDQDTAFLDRYKMAPQTGVLSVFSKEKKTKDTPIYFQISDGMVEEESALGVCRRSEAVDPEFRLIGSCKAFENNHHLSLTGMAREVADHIVRELVAR